MFRRSSKNEQSNNMDSLKQRYPPPTSAPPNYQAPQAQPNQQRSSTANNTQSTNQVFLNIKVFIYQLNNFLKC